VATTISKPIRDLNDRLKAVAEKADTYAGGRGGELSDIGRSEIEKLVTQLEAQMRLAAKELEFERAAAIRDELRTLRLGVLGDDKAVAVQRLAERAATAMDQMGPNRTRRSEPAKRAPGQVAHTVVAPALDSAADWLPGLRDEHEEANDEASDTLPDAEAQSRTGRALATSRRATWDPSVTPNVVKRRGERPKRRG